MYGSSFCIVTRKPRAFSSRPSDDAVRPFPRELATPPVTKMCFVTTRSSLGRRLLDGTSPYRAGTAGPRCLRARGVERGQQLGGVAAGGGAVGRARQHAGQLDLPVVAVEDRRLGDASRRRPCAW